jgi:hypothetical protein
MYLKAYFAALAHDWLALMSGIASVIVAFFSAYFPPVNVAAGRTTLWITAVVCFVCSSYRVWVKEHKKAKNVLEGRSKPIDKEVLKKLTGFIASGHEIMQAAVNSLATSPHLEESESWSQEVTDYLESQGLKILAIRFNSAAVTDKYYGNHYATTKPIADRLTTKIVRLEEFIKELAGGNM